MSKIKQWLASPQVPSIIQEIKSLNDHIYAPNNSDNDGVMDGEDKTQTCTLVGKAIPKDIQPLLQNNNSEIHLLDRLKCDGVMYSMYQTHQDNSQVSFYPNSNKNLAPIAGFVQYIYSVGTKSNITFLVMQYVIPMDNSVIYSFAMYIIGLLEPPQVI